MRQNMIRCLWVTAAVLWISVPEAFGQECTGTWRGLQVCDERPREGYDRGDYGSAYSRLEDDIIDRLPSAMKTGDQVYTPYSCTAFDIRANGTAATDIEHIVALGEAHDSGIASNRRRDIAADLDNLTIAAPQVNRQQKSDRDAGEWAPDRHGAWFAGRVIAVKRQYGLSVDARERDALEALLAGGGANLDCTAGAEDPVRPETTIKVFGSPEATCPIGWQPAGEPESGYAVPAGPSIRFLPEAEVLSAPSWPHEMNTTARKRAADQLYSPAESMTCKFHGPRVMLRDGTVAE